MLLKVIWYFDKYDLTGVCIID